jgi:hypothetical protein
MDSLAWKMEWQSAEAIAACVISQLHWLGEDSGIGHVKGSPERGEGWVPLPFFFFCKNGA